MPALTLHDAQQADVETVLPLWRELMDRHADLDSHFRRAADGDERFAEYLGLRIADEESRVVLAKRQGETVGYALGVTQLLPRILQARYIGRITDLAVRTDCQRQGVGSALVEELTQWFGSREITRIEVSVVPTNRAAEAFWSKHGFYIFQKSLARIHDTMGR